MRNSIFLLALFALFQVTGYSQVNDDISVVCMGYGKKAEKSFWVRGEKANHFIDYLFQNNPNAKRRGCKHKFRKVSIPGIEGTLSLKIFEGVHGRKKDGNCISSYFNIFEDEKYKASRMSNLGDGEQYGIVIYVKKRGRDQYLSNPNKDAIVQFIRNNCCP
ncbi:MAG: hypothetical protein HUJ25_14920 [Crocinitomicaceae bacterium]|nr:hypothetical protein [Crocinitomicaceae bacterium]